MRTTTPSSEKPACYQKRRRETKKEITSYPNKLADPLGLEHLEL